MANDHDRGLVFQCLMLVVYFLENAFIFNTLTLAELLQGTKYEVGDIVSILDRDGGVYFAIIRGFLLDQYAEKHAVLTWLLPRYPNPTHFDPALFVLGTCVGVFEVIFSAHTCLH